ncbi:hypothetical protein EV130_103387 [Rhizobium azibense]|uniref:Uncharacterized protein n=1 Tax=Rhizobium azibense TaxID=1136135 RepID=A0A4R3R0L1_9HYPH|nr:hypothetical protein EV130_103387 [Rhizobium azibense]
MALVRMLKSVLMEHGVEHSGQIEQYHLSSTEALPLCFSICAHRSRRASVTTRVILCPVEWAIAWARRWAADLRRADMRVGADIVVT